MNELILAEKEYLTSKLGIRELAKKYSVNRQVLTGWLMAKGIEISNRRAEKSFNISFFDEINTEEKAYWLGFMFADGFIGQYKKSYKIELSLATRDFNHLEKFASAIMFSKIKKSDNRCRVFIGSKKMFEKLNEYGCTERKSLTLKFPRVDIFQEKSLIIHFIRGYFDGDGCITHSDKDGKKLNVTILGTEEFLSGLNKCIYPEKEMKLTKKGNVYVLSFNGKTGLEFLKRIYSKSTVYLDRKKQKYNEYCRLYEESYR